jgi:hypothetical protein
MGQTTSRELIKLLVIPNTDSTPHKYTYYDMRIDPDFLATREEYETEFEHIVRASEVFKGKTQEEILESLSNM